MEGIGITVVQGDARNIPADALVLKYTQSLRGLEGEVLKEFEDLGLPIFDKLPAQREYYLTDGGAVSNAAKIVFIGVPNLDAFGYSEIRDFGKKTLALLAFSAPNAKSVLMTVHGTGYGLDEKEAFESQIAGLLDSIRDRNIPGNLAEICFAERNPARAKRLQNYLDKLFPTRRIPNPLQYGNQDKHNIELESLETVGSDSENKKKVFVAMPFDPEFDDIFHYGIKGAVHAYGFLCERADLEAFTGDVMDWVKRRIRGAEFVVADLSRANPNVYLEVGYAWGRNKPTILLIKNTKELRFDTRSQKCIQYDRIKDLETKLRKELNQLIYEE